MADAASAAAAAALPSDATLARKLQAVDQLTSIFGFEREVAAAAVDVIADSSRNAGPAAAADADTAIDVTACYNYILDQGLATDNGGPVTPIDNCPHATAELVCLGVNQLPLQPASAPCSHTDTNSTADATAGSLKSTGEPCAATENWLCLECGVVRCSRYCAGHALDHYQSAATGPHHCIQVSLTDLSVWCHECGKYLSTHTGATGAILQPIVATLEQLKFASNDSVTITLEQQQQPASKKQRSDDGDMDTGEDEKKPAAQKAGGSSSSSSSSDNDQAEEIGVEGDSELLDLIAAAAESQGIPLEWLLHHANNHDDDDESVEYPFEKLPTSLKDVADFIQSDKCQSILILAGAGMSVASGIPDFRSADGLYATLNPDLLSASAEQRKAIGMDPTLALEQNLFLDNPLPCLELQREFILGTRAQRWKATLAHRFIELLHTKTGKLIRHYTQNIDGLEDQCTGVPPEKVIAVHGSMDRAECARCSEPSDFGEFCDSVQSQIKDLSGKDTLAPSESTPIECSTCGYAAMKPAIVLFRSSLPKVFFECIPKDVQNVDLLIVIGTSLRVAPANSLVWRVPKSAMRVLVNREEAGDHLGMDFDEDASRDYFAQGECDAVLLELMDHLGWTEDLEPLLPAGKLPKSCDRLLRENLDKRTNRSKSEESSK